MEWKLRFQEFLPTYLGSAKSVAIWWIISWFHELLLHFCDSFSLGLLPFGCMWFMETDRCTVFENHEKSHIQHCEILKTWNLRSNSVTRQVNFNRAKIGGKCQNSNETFWVIFKHCALQSCKVLWRLLLNFEAYVCMIFSCFSVIG